MPADVLFESRTVESDTMAGEEEEAAPSTCCQSLPKVNEPPSEQTKCGSNAMLNVVSNIKDEDKLSHSVLISSEVFLSCQKRLQEQEKITNTLKGERDKQLRDIETYLMVMESELRKEQSQIHELLRDKDRTIAVQERQIHALLQLNRKLSAKLDKHSKCSLWKRNSLQSKSVIGGAATTTTKPMQCVSSHDSNDDFVTNENEISDLVENSSEKKHGDDCGEEDDLEQRDTCSENGTEQQKSSSDASDPSVNDLEYQLNTVDECFPDYDSESETSDCFSHPKRLHTLEELDETEDLDQKESESEGTGLVSKFPAHSIELDKTLHLSACYNRVMSNHRNVTKPKDVKYKKINRVKSRSLEELRGKLRNWTHPFFLSEKST